MSYTYYTGALNMIKVDSITIDALFQLPGCVGYKGNGSGCAAYKLSIAMGMANDDESWQKLPIEIRDLGIDHDLRVMRVLFRDYPSFCAVLDNLIDGTSELDEYIVVLIRQAIDNATSRDKFAVTIFPNSGEAWDIHVLCTKRIFQEAVRLGLIELKDGLAQEFEFELHKRTIRERVQLDMAEVININFADQVRVIRAPIDAALEPITEQNWELVPS
jgi:hypothetical protein